MRQLDKPFDYTYLPEPHETSTVRKLKLTVGVVVNWCCHRSSSSVLEIPLIKLKDIKWTSHTEKILLKWLHQPISGHSNIGREARLY